MDEEFEKAVNEIKGITCALEAAVLALLAAHPAPETLKRYLESAATGARGRLVIGPSAHDRVAPFDRTLQVLLAPLEEPHPKRRR